MSLLRNKHLLIASFGHFALDVYSGFTPLIWPMVSGPMGLTYGMVGTASTLYSLFSSLTQPFFGYLGDRFGTRYLAGLCLGGTALFMGLVGFVDSYPMLVLTVVLIGLGVGGFHPQGAMNAAVVSGSQKATGMSIFSLGGTAAHAVGPLLAAWLFITPLGLKSTTLLIVPGLLTAYWLYRIMLEVDQHRQATARSRADSAVPEVRLLAVAALVLVVGMRSWTFSSTTTYVPLLYKSLGLPLTFSGQTLFLIQTGGAVGVMAGGYLADRLGRRRVTALSLLLFVPAAYFFYRSPDILIPLAALVFGFLGEASMAITTVIGQDLLPRHVGVASGLLFGLAFVAGGLGVALTGFVADQFGLLQTLQMLFVLPLVGSALCLLLPRAQPAAQPVPG